MLGTLLSLCVIAISGVPSLASPGSKPIDVEKSRGEFFGDLE